MKWCSWCLCCRRDGIVRARMMWLSRRSSFKAGGDLETRKDVVVVMSTWKRTWFEVRKNVHAACSCHSLQVAAALCLELSARVEAPTKGSMAGTRMMWQHRGGCCQWLLNVFAEESPIVCRWGEGCRTLELGKRLASGRSLAEFNPASCLMVTFVGHYRWAIRIFDSVTIRPSMPLASRADRFIEGYKTQRLPKFPNLTVVAGPSRPDFQPETLLRPPHQ